MTSNIDTCGSPFYSCYVFVFLNIPFLFHSAFCENNHVLKSCPFSSELVLMSDPVAINVSGNLYPRDALIMLSQPFLFQG